MSTQHPQIWGLGFTSVPLPPGNVRPRGPEPSFYSDGVYANGCYYWNDGTVECDDNRQLAPAPVNPRPRLPAPSPKPICPGCAGDEHDHHLLPRPEDKSLAAALGLTPTQFIVVGVVGFVALLMLIKPKKGSY